MNDGSLRSRGGDPVVDLPCGDWWQQSLRGNPCMAGAGPGDPTMDPGQ